MAVSAEGRRWFLLNASPDLRLQIEAFPPLLAGVDGQRGTAIEGVLLTNADLDHCLGLTLLREDARVRVHATAAAQAALSAGLGLPALLEDYGGADWVVPPSQLAILADRAGHDSGLRYCAFPAPGKPPRYREGRAAPQQGDNVGYLVVDAESGGRLVFLPDVAAFDQVVLRALESCQVLLVDGTFWSEEEMAGLGPTARSAAAMAHLPVGGERGSLATLAALPIARKIYVHINNTNPMLREGSAERAAVIAAGLAIGEDGWEVTC